MLTLATLHYSLLPGSRLQFRRWHLNSSFSWASCLGSLQLQLFVGENINTLLYSCSSGESKMPQKWPDWRLNIKDQSISIHATEQWTASATGSGESTKELSSLSTHGYWHRHAVQKSSVVICLGRQREEDRHLIPWLSKTLLLSGDFNFHCSILCQIITFMWYLLLFCLVLLRHTSFSFWLLKYCSDSLAVFLVVAT